MKRIIYTSLLALVFTACGTSEEKKAKKEPEKLDQSIEQLQEKAKKLKEKSLELKKQMETSNGSMRNL